MDSSPLARLPTELQALIFEYAVSYAEPLRIRYCATDCPSTRAHRIEPAALFQACRQIHRQFSHSLYSLNDFVVRLPSNYDGGGPILDPFFRTIGRHNARLIPRIYVEISGNINHFGQDVPYLRSIVDSLAHTTTIPTSCELLVRPLLLINQHNQSARWAHAIMRDVHLNARDIENSLRSAIERVQMKLKMEEDQARHLDLFWIKKVYGDYLCIEEQQGIVELDADGEKQAQLRDSSSRQSYVRWKSL